MRYARGTLRFDCTVQRGAQEGNRLGYDYPVVLAVSPLLSRQFGIFVHLTNTVLALQFRSWMSMWLVVPNLKSACQG